RESVCLSVLRPDNAVPSQAASILSIGTPEANICIHHTVGSLVDKRSSIMLQRALTLSRYIVFVAVIAALAASVALILYEAAVVAEVIFNAVKQGGFQLTSGRALAVGLIEAIDVFLIAIVALVIGLGLHRLFVDETLPLPRWLKIDDLEDLKGYLVSIVI